MVVVDLYVAHSVQLDKSGYPSVRVATAAASPPFRPVRHRLRNAPSYNRATDTTTLRKRPVFSGYSERA
ncbi:hypothetical protein J6590_028363 [Homalodisca vitripennis]|nr:hypothetical protein J6590_028363 [Homalodisca vitripennis]